MVFSLSILEPNHSFFIKLKQMDFSKTKFKLQQSILRPLKIVEIVVLVFFILFLIFSVPIPSMIACWIDNPLGVALLLILAAYLLFVYHPVVGVVFLFVVYELVRRSSMVVHVKIPIMDYTGTEKHRNRVLEKMNPVEPMSVDEETVVQYGAYQTNPTTTYHETSFHPVYDKAPNSSPFD